MENVKIDEVSGAAMAQFAGFLTFDQHKSIGNDILDYAAKNDIKKLIIDTAELKVIAQETQNWIQSDWFPKANKVGVSHMAFIIPSDVFGKMSTKAVNQKAGNIEIQNFDKISEARIWIKKS